MTTCSITINIIAHGNKVHTHSSKEILVLLGSSDLNCILLWLDILWFLGQLSVTTSIFERRKGVRFLGFNFGSYLVGFSRACWSWDFPLMNDMGFSLSLAVKLTATYWTLIGEEWGSLWLISGWKLWVLSKRKLCKWNVFCGYGRAMQWGSRGKLVVVSFMEN